MSLLDLTSVKPHLKIDQATDNQVLQDKLDSAETFVATELDGAGALSIVSLTEAHDGGAWLIKTLCRPIVTITSLNESYGTYNRTLTEQPLDGSNGFTAYGYTVEKDAGVIERRISGVSGPFASGRRNITVAYTTGYATADDVPDDVVEAVRLVTQHFYATQRGSNRKSTGGAPGSTSDSMSRAMEIISRLRVSGF